MNILIARFTSPLNRSVVEKAFKGIEIGYYGCLSSRSEAFLPLHAKERAFFDTRQMKWGEYKIDWSTVAPLDEEIVERMRSCEAVFLEMLSRLEERRYLRYEDRKRLYLIHLRYWNHLLDKKKINFFLSVGMPHETPDYVIYCLCKAKGIKTLYFLSCPVKDTLFMAEDPRQSVVELKERFQFYRGPKDIVLSDTFERYYQRQISDPDPKPWGVQRFPTPRERWWIKIVDILKKNPINFLWSVLCFIGRKFTPYYWMDALEQHQKYSRTKKAIAFYEYHAREPDLSRRYIYIPLHVQPECSTCPLGGAFGDQQLMVALIAAYLPDDVFLYVKEHPNQFAQYPDGRCRDIAFYRELLGTKNVRFIPKSTNTFKLTEHALAVATVTGVAGFEALFRGKPTMMFGNYLYQYAPGVFPIKTREDCKNAMEKILGGQAGPAFHEMRAFLKGMEDIAIRGYFDAPALYNVPPSMPAGESVANIVKALRKRIME